MYIHVLEYGNAGDAAKLLQNAAPERTQLFVHGIDEEEARLDAELEKCKDSPPLLLFPDDTAMSLEEWMEARLERVKPSRPNVEEEGTEEGDGESASGEKGQERERVDAGGPLRVMIVDAPWGRARRMMHHLSARHPEIPHIKLKPITPSVYGRNLRLSNPRPYLNLNTNKILIKSE